MNHHIILSSILYLESVVAMLQQLVNGLILGSVYALLALGYTMVYGIIKLINFAHGDIYMMGAFMGYFLINFLHLNFFLALIFAMIGTAALGVLVEFLAYRPLRNSTRIAALITAIGVSYLLENGVQLLLGADAKVVPSIIDLGTVQVFGSTLSGTALLTVAVTIVATVVLTLLVQKTRLGKAMRAVSEDMGAARLMGVNVNSTISFTFAVGSALAGIAAILYSMAYQQVSPTMGVMLGTKAFVAAVLGGIGSIPGAVIGGLIVGFSEVFVAAFGLSVWQDAVVFLLLILVLVVKPTGLLGRPVTEKV